MGSISIFVAMLALAFIVYSAEAAGSCPLPSKVYSCSPKCKENYECSNGRVCCPNSCNAKSCSEPSGNGGSGGSSGDKYNKQGGGAGVYCNNVKCNAFEVCKMDPATKRMKCMRA